MDVAVDVFDDLQTALEMYYPDADWSDLPPLLRYASWIGGDRDGNPNVTSDVTLETLATLRKAARRVYVRSVDFLREHLTQSIDEVSVSTALLDSLKGAVDPATLARYPSEIYRQKMDLIGDKLHDNGYKSGQELLTDLQLVADSLMHNRGQHVVQGALRRLIQKVKIFGLHLAPLDIREDAQRHAAALDEMFRDYYGEQDSYATLPEAEKQVLLTKEIASSRPFFPAEPNFSDTTNQVIATWRMIAVAHKQYGKDCIDSMVASMTQSPSATLAMLMFATEPSIQDAV